MERANPQIQEICKHEFDLSRLNEDGEAPRDEADRDALLFTAALRGARNAPDAREDRIAAIRAAIAGGSYEIDAKRIAIALIREDPWLFKA